MLLERKNIRSYYFILGAFSTIICMLLFSFAQPIDKTGDAVNHQPTGVYHAVASERGFMMYNTLTGEYLLNSDVNYIGGVRWNKGSFEEAVHHGRDLNRKRGK